MAFDSPRFQGDPLLEEILDDPDTGTKKLRQGSPADSVRRVQQALFDLNWSGKIATPVTDEATFVDGDYGSTESATSKTVVAFKTHYGINFAGLIDGFTGPRTLQALDGQCVLLDEAAEAIERHAAELAVTGVPVQLTSSKPPYVPILGTHGVYRVAMIYGDSGGIFYQQDGGTFEVHGTLAEAHAARGGVTGELGFPRSDEYEDGDGYRRSDFERGSLRFDPAGGTAELIGN